MTCNLAVLLLGIYPTGIFTWVHRGTHEGHCLWWWSVEGSLAGRMENWNMVNSSPYTLRGRMQQIDNNPVIHRNVDKSYAILSYKNNNNLNNRHYLYSIYCVPITAVSLSQLCDVLLLQLKKLRYIMSHRKWIFWDLNFGNLPAEFLFWSSLFCLRTTMRAVEQKLKIFYIPNYNTCFCRIHQNVLDIFPTKGNN